jgi:hypothetical protein
MALTRPKIWDLDTTVEYFKDPLTTLHQGSTRADVDVGFIFNRANGLVSNVALYWSESTQSVVTAFTSNSGTTDSNVSVSSYANLTVGNVLLVNGGILNVTGNITGNLVGTLYGNIVTSGNLIAGNVGANGYYFANGTNILSTVTSSYGNTQVAAYLPTYTGTLSYGTASALVSSNTTAGIGTTPTAIDTFSAAAYRGAKYVISTSDITNSQYQIAEVILTQDNTNVGMSVYGISYTGTTARMTFTSNITSGTVTVWATGVSANNTVKLARTLIPV